MQALPERCRQLVGVIAFYLALWLFGWMETVWVLVMLAPMLVLLRAERGAWNRQHVLDPVWTLIPKV